MQKLSYELCNQFLKLCLRHTNYGTYVTYVTAAVRVPTLTARNEFRVSHVHLCTINSRLLSHAHRHGK